MGMMIGAAVLALPLILATVTLLAGARAQRLAPPDGQFRVVPGGRLHYTDQGTGPAIVLIHGLGGQLRNFATPLVDHLAQSHRVIAVDRPGSGYSTYDGAFPDLHGQARMIAALIEALSLGPVTLVGHSLGGALSLALVTTRPDLVAKLALVAPLTLPTDTMPPHFAILTIRAAWLRRLIAWTVIAPAGLLAGLARQSPVFAPDAMPPDFASRGGGALLFRPSAFDAASRDLQTVPAALATIVAAYPTIDRPVHVLFGTGDQILNPTLHGETFATRVASARCDLIPGGHMLPFTHPETTAQWIAAVGMAR